MPYRVFISHGWEDLWVAQQIKRRIESGAKARTFIDAFDIQKGDDFEDRIFDEMERTQELVVLFTPWSVGRHWLWVEVGAARANGCRIVPVLHHVSFDEIDSAGGTTFLKAKNAVDINEFDAYLIELRRRVVRHRR